MGGTNWPIQVYCGVTVTPDSRMMKYRSLTQKSSVRKI